MTREQMVDEAVRRAAKRYAKAYWFDKEPTLADVCREWLNIREGHQLAGKTRSVRYHFRKVVAEQPQPTKFAGWSSW